MLPVLPLNDGLGLLEVGGCIDVFQSEPVRIDSSELVAGDEARVQLGDELLRSELPTIEARFENI